MSKFNRNCLYNVIVDKDKILAFQHLNIRPIQAYFIRFNETSNHVNLYCNFRLLDEGPNNLILINTYWDDTVLANAVVENSVNRTNATFERLDDRPQGRLIDYFCFENFINGSKSACALQGYRVPFPSLGYSEDGYEGNGKYRAIYSSHLSFSDPKFQKYYNISLYEKCDHQEGGSTECKDSILGKDFVYPFPPPALPDSGASDYTPLLMTGLLGAVLCMY